jgi:hypothetical protein
MARIRSVHPGLFIDDAFMELSMGARMLLVGIWGQADDQGVFEWRPKSLKAAIFPGDSGEIDDMLGELVDRRFVKPFDHEGKRYGACRNFMVWQKVKNPSYRYTLPQDYLNYVGFDRKKTVAVPQPSPSPPEKSPLREEVIGNREEVIGNPKTKTESLKRESPGIDSTMPSASPPGSLSEVSQSVLKEVGSKPIGLGAVIGTVLPDMWIPDEKLYARVTADFGMAHDDIQAELQAFHAHHAANGSFSANWSASFVTWCKRWKEHRAKQSAPRLELSKAPSAPFEPTEADWDKAINKFKANESYWPRWAGNGPDSRCPPAILEKHGWDQKLRRFVPPAPTDEDWHKACEMYATTGRWPRSALTGWSPDPMSPGCKAPKHILEKYEINLETGERQLPPKTKTIADKKGAVA